MRCSCESISFYTVITILGCPTPGLYGSNYYIQPHVLMLSVVSDCHLETGAYQGCKPGYRGHHCELGF